MDSLRQDLRQAVRSLAKSPGFATAAILTLALGIGASTAIFGVVYGVLQRPLPYRDPASLVLVGAEHEFAGVRRPSSFSAFEIQEFRERPRTLASLGGYSVSTLAFEGPDGVEPLEGAFVTTDFFSTLGQPPAAGRLLGPGDDVAPMAVIGQRLAQRLFGGGPEAVGATLALSGRAYTVVGVAASDFRIPDAARTSGRRWAWLSRATSPLAQVAAGRRREPRGAPAARHDRRRGALRHRRPGPPDRRRAP